MKKIYIGIFIMASLFSFCIQDANAWIYFISDLPAATSLLNSAFGQYQYQPKLAKGFANASVYSSDVATQRGFQGYDKFAITIGTMGAAQVPRATSDLTYYKQLAEKLKKQGDVYVGVAWNAWALNVGVKLPADFYLSFKFGKLKYSYLDFDFDGMNAGGMINYQLVSPKAPPIAIILWRGLSVGTGFLWQYNKTAYHYTGSLQTDAGLAMQPKLKIFAKTESYVIPLELSTAIRLFWFLNIHAGGGIDFAMGSARLNYSSTGVIFNGPNINFYSVYGRQSGTGPRHYMPKIFCGPGISLGPVIIDVPLTYYFFGGFNAGITVGVVW
jgi:hypothetical protein